MRYTLTADVEKNVINLEDFKETFLKSRNTLTAKAIVNGAQYSPGSMSICILKNNLPITIRKRISTSKAISKLFLPPP